MSINDMVGRRRTIWEWVKFVKYSRSRYLVSIVRLRIHFSLVDGHADILFPEGNDLDPPVSLLHGTLSYLQN